MSNEKMATGREMIGPLIIMVVVAAALLGGVFYWQYYAGKKGAGFMAKAASAPQAISTIKAEASDWQSFLQSTGSLRAVRGADLSAQAAGVVDVISFDSGNDVPAGQVLVRLKPNDDYAKLDQLKAAAELADQTLKRDQEQFAAQAVSQAVIDTDVSTLKSARAQVVAQQALIEEKIVKAPFAGRLGIRQVDIGQYLSAGTAVVTLQALDPILIDFYLPQQALAQVKIGQTVTASIDTFPGQQFAGTLESINAKIDLSSRNVQVRASFHNPDKRLIPGMFATVRIAAGAKASYITVPQTAITYNPYGDTVYVAEPGKDQDGKPLLDDKGAPRLTAQQRFVKLGATRGDQISVLSGIQPGETVVTAGQLKLRNGSFVVVNNAIGPANDVHPNPPNE